MIFDPDGNTNILKELDTTIFLKKVQKNNKRSVIWSLTKIIWYYFKQMWKIQV